ncbi:MAG: hypothetical protein WBA51_06130 [Erythrobacter sp.]
MSNTGEPGEDWGTDAGRTLILARVWPVRVLKTELPDRRAIRLPP